MRNSLWHALSEFDAEHYSVPSAYLDVPSCLGMISQISEKKHGEVCDTCSEIDDGENDFWAYLSREQLPNNPGSVSGARR